MCMSFPMMCSTNCLSDTLSSSKSPYSSQFFVSTMSLSFTGTLSPSLSFSLSSSIFALVPADGEGVLDFVVFVCVCPFFDDIYDIISFLCFRTDFMTMLFLVLKYARVSLAFGCH
jgi:hypothetical protein